MAQVILGDAPPELGPMVASDIATETVWQVAIEQSKYWKKHAEEGTPAWQKITVALIVDGLEPMDKVRCTSWFGRLYS